MRSPRQESPKTCIVRKICTISKLYSVFKGIRRSSESMLNGYSKSSEEKTLSISSFHGLVAVWLLAVLIYLEQVDIKRAMSNQLNKRCHWLGLKFGGLHSLVLQERKDLMWLSARTTPLGLNDSSERPRIWIGLMNTTKAMLILEWSNRFVFKDFSSCATKI